MGNLGIFCEKWCYFINVFEGGLFLVGSLVFDVMMVINFFGMLVIKCRFKSLF